MTVAPSFLFLINTVRLNKLALISMVLKLCYNLIEKRVSVEIDCLQCS